jgi:hypothetical protein
VPQFCRHNRFTAECPICSKGTVLDPSRAPGRRSGSPRRPTAKEHAAPGPGFKGPYASAGPYTDDHGTYEVRLESVPGGLRLASWTAGQIRRAAPVLAVEDLPGLLQRAAASGVLDRSSGLLEAARDPSASPPEHGASPGRTGELREELRVEALGDGRMRVARWLLRPGRGWELQEAPVMLPAARYAEALESAAAAGILASG